MDAMKNNRFSVWPFNGTLFLKIILTWVPADSDGHFSVTKGDTFKVFKGKACNIFTHFEKNHSFLQQIVDIVKQF